MIERYCRGCDVCDQKFSAKGIALILRFAHIAVLILVLNRK